MSRKGVRTRSQVVLETNKQKEHNTSVKETTEDSKYGEIVETKIETNYQSKPQSPVKPMVKQDSNQEQMTKKESNQKFNKKAKEVERPQQQKEKKNNPVKEVEKPYNVANDQMNAKQYEANAAKEKIWKLTEDVGSTSSSKNSETKHLAPFKDVEAIVPPKAISPNPPQMSDKNDKVLNYKEKLRNTLSQTLGSQSQKSQKVTEISNAQYMTNQPNSSNVQANVSAQGNLPAQNMMNYINQQHMSNMTMNPELMTQMMATQQIMMQDGNQTNNSNIMQKLPMGENSFIVSVPVSAANNM